MCEFFDVNAVAAMCEAALEAELVKIDKGFYILDDEEYAIVPEDEAEEMDAIYKYWYQLPGDENKKGDIGDIYGIKFLIEKYGAKILQKERFKYGH